MSKIKLKILARTYDDYECGSLMVSLFLIPFFVAGGFSFAVVKVAALALATITYSTCGMARHPPGVPV